MDEKMFAAMRELLSASLAYREIGKAVPRKGTKKYDGAIDEFVKVRQRLLAAENACLAIVQEHDANG